MKNFLQVTISCGFLLCLILVPMTVHATVIFNYQGEVTSIYEDDTQPLTSAGFSLGDLFYITLQFDENTEGDSPTPISRVYDDAVVSFTVSNEAYTATGVGGNIYIQDVDEGPGADLFYATADFLSSPDVEGLESDYMTFVYRSDHSAFDDTVFSSTGLPLEPFETLGPITPFVNIHWESDNSYPYDDQYMSISNLSLVQNPVPEPATILLLGGGLAGLAFYRRKRK